MLALKTLPLGSWAPLGNKLYYVSPDWTARTYQHARIYCQRIGGDLLQPWNELINNLLRNPTIADGMWIGLNDLSKEGTFQWVDETTVGDSYTPWLDDQPVSGPDADFVYLTDSGWGVKQCDERLVFACETGNVLPSGSWISFGTSTYFMSPSWLLLSFHDARNYCRGLGADLPQPKNEETVDFLQTSIESDTWIGLSDIESEGTYIWVDGTVQGQRFPSMNSSRSRGEDADCVFIRENGKWDVQSCNIRMRFVCESTQEPARLMAATATPFGSETRDSSYICLLSPPDDRSSAQVTTQRLVKISASFEENTLVVPGSNNAMIPDSLPVVINQSLPSAPDNTAMGVFECKAAASSGAGTTVSVVILLHIRHYQPIDGRFTRTIYPGDSTSLSVSKLDMGPDMSDIRWQKFKDVYSQDSKLPESNGQLSHYITNATHQDADVYGTFMSGQLFQHRHSFIRVIVQVCPRGRWDPPSCQGVCDNCYNGGICHQQSGTCICPPGFSGKNCLTACAVHRFGWECELECGPGHPLDQCAGSQICLPDPYGCNCLAGYTGIYCNETCDPGKFDVDCLQDCHCISGTLCNRFTGNCLEGCEDGWSGPSCQVPMICAADYYGENCTEKCHCLDGLPCEKDTGSCLESNGECAVGYIPDAEGPFDNCRQYSGCYDTCLRTCHCSDGAPDCHSETGICTSNKCALRWTGVECQTDRFAIRVEKANPGLARVHCSFSTVDQPLPTGGINIALNGALVGSLGSTLLDINEGVNQSTSSFLIESITKDDVFHCTIGSNPVTQKPLISARVPQLQFYKLPILTSAPTVSEVGVQHITLTWREWDSATDNGEGPITGYTIYIRTMTNEQPHEMKWVPSSTGDNQPLGASMVNSYTSSNITDLEPETEYMLSLSVSREGLNGEGPEGDPVSVRTRPTLIAPMSGSSSIPSIAGGAVGALLAVLLVAVLIIFIFRRRRTLPETGATSKSEGKESELSPRYENPVFDQSKPDSHTYQDLDTAIHTYQDLNTDTHAYQDLNIVTPNYQNVSDSHTYQDLKKPDQETNYEELSDATQMKRDYINVQDI